MATLSEEMASWIACLRYEDLPAEVIARAKRVLLDSIGCAIGALNVEPVQIARRVVLEQGGNPVANPLGCDWKTSCDQAAFLGGLAIRYFDFNDYTTTGSHPSTNVAAALAMAQAGGLSGKDLIVGLVVGYEVQMRIRTVLEKSKQDYWDQSTALHYTAAAVAGKLLRLPPLKFAHALALAGIHAVTLAEVRRGKLSMWKAGAEPMGIKNGIYAALLARSGMTGPLTVLEGNHGFGKAVSGDINPRIFRDPPKTFQILTSCIKPWPCLFVAQAPIAAALEVRTKGVDPEKIRKITLSLSDFGFKQQKRFMKSGISTREDADHSAVYCVVRALLDGRVWLHHFEEKYFKEPRVLDLLKKVSLRFDPSLPKKMGAKVEVVIDGGKQFSSRVPYAPGHVKNPLSEDRFLEKFYGLCDGDLGRDRSQKAAELVSKVEEITDLGVLLEAVRANRKEGQEMAEGVET